MSENLTGKTDEYPGSPSYGKGVYPCQTYDCNIWVYVDLSKVDNYFKWSLGKDNILVGLSFRGNYIPPGATLNYRKVLIIQDQYDNFKSKFGCFLDRSKNLDIQEQIKTFYARKSKAM